MKYSRLWEIEGFKAIAPYERVLKVLISPDIQGAKNISLGMTLLLSGSKSSYHAHDEEEEIWFVTSGILKIDKVLEHVKERSVKRK